MVFIAHKIDIHIVLFGEFVDNILQLLWIFGGVEIRVFPGFDGFAVVYREDNHRFVGLLADHLEHRRKQQECKQRHREPAQRSHDDAVAFLESHIVVAKIEIQRIADTEQDGENRQPKRILCK